MSGLAGTKLSSFTFKTYDGIECKLIRPRKNRTLLRNTVAYLTFPSGSDMTDSAPEVVMTFTSSQSPFDS